MTATLYEMIDAKGALLEQIEATGELTPELIAALDAGNEQIRTKIERCVKYIRNREALADMKRAEAKRLREEADADESVAAKVRAYVLYQMDRDGMTKVETPIATVRVGVAAKPVIRWTRAADDIPESLRRVKIELDAAAALEAYKAGTLPEGFDVKPPTKFLKGV